jgi:hypothetical protein
MLTRAGTSSDWLNLIRAEYKEIPGLNLTKAQIQRLWGLDPLTCDALVDRLIADGFLKRTSANVYVRVGLGR